MHHPVPVALTLALLLTGLLSACSPKEQATTAGPMAGMPPPEVEVIVAAPAAVTRTTEVPGRLQAVRSAEVRARVEGILERRLYREGSEVKAGEALFQIDPSTLKANVDAAAAALAKAKAQALVAAQNLQRRKDLLESNFISALDYDQSVAAKAQADAEVAAAEAALSRARIDLSYATVTAPISGRIGRAFVTEGALVRKDEATPLATIEQYNPIWADFALSSAIFLRLREAKAVGGPVTLLLDDGSTYPHPGKLLFSDLAVDPSTGSVGMRAEFPNPERALLPGQFVTLRLPLTRAESVIVVPQRAVQVSPQGQAVMLVGPDGKVMPQPVKTGGLAGRDWVITEGLKGGEQVIVNGVQKARPGMAVKPMPLKAN